MVDVTLGEVRVEVLAFDDTEKELINNLKVRPSEFQNGLVFFGVERISSGVHRRGYRTEEVGSELRGIGDRPQIIAWMNAPS